MRTIDYVHQKIIPVALSLLPTNFDTPEARAMLLAIGLQESAFAFRAQVGGPARGFWEFEAGGGFAGIIKHPATKDLMADICRTLCYGEPGPEDFQALTNNDVLACATARLLLWTCPAKLPARTDPAEGWRQYHETWRPGAPRPATWTIYYGQAWQLVAPPETGGTA